MTDTTQGVSYRDPQSMIVQQELGLTARQIVLRAKKMGLRTTKIYGRTWVASDDLERLKEGAS